MQEQDLITVEISDFTQDAKGVGHIDGLAVFVPYALPGDTVRAQIKTIKKRYLEADLIEIIEPSTERRNLVDPNSIICEAAPLINLNHSAQIAWKQKLVADQLRKIAKLNIDESPIKVNANPLHELHYRNKVNLKFDENGYISMSRRGTNFLERIDSHPLFQDSINDFIYEWNNSYLSELNLGSVTEKLSEIVIRINSLGELMLNFFVKDINDKTKTVLSKILEMNPNIKVLALTEAKERHSFNNKTEYITHETELKENIAGISFSYGVHTFLQVNNDTLQDIYRKSEEFLVSNDSEHSTQNLLDLYCGIGINSIFLAQNFQKVIGVEYVKSSIKAARKNAIDNHANNVEFFVGKAEDLIEDLVAEHRIDKVYVDPPRKGLDIEVINCIVSSSINEVLYMSCNPATLARDLGVFVEAGFYIKSIEIIDQFPNTTHVETVALVQNL